MSGCFNLVKEIKNKNGKKTLEEVLNIGEQAELRRILDEISDGPAEEFRISYVGQGQNYLILRAESQKNRFCVRIGVSEQEETISDLKEALSICESNGVFTNQVRFFDFSCSKIHRPYMITTFISGDTYDIDKIPEENRESFFSDFGGYLAGLHSIKHPFFSKEIRTKNRLDIREYLSGRYQKLYEGLMQCGDIWADESGLDKVWQKLYSEIDFDKIVPRFVHRDISANNMIIQAGKFNCLIDFEHAIFFDCVWDFVKLELNILSKTDHRYRAIFFDSYQSIIPLKQERDSQVRYRLYCMLELMWAVVNDYEDSRDLYLNYLKEFIEKEG